MSRQNHILHFHISKKREIDWLDKAAIVAAFIFPMTGIPQVIEVFQGSIEGVSLWSWIGFAAFSGFFMLYGIVHRIMPMIVTNVLWLAVDSLVVLGVAAHHMTI